MFSLGKPKPLMKLMTSAFTQILSAFLFSGGIFMLLSLALIFLIGMSAAAIFQKIGIPRIIGMLAAGIITGPYVLDLLDQTILGISAELRQIALIIILIKAGLSLDLSDLKKVGRPAVMMSFVPASFEILGYLCFAPLLLGISTLEAAVMGAVLGAVSPAVVVPRMVRLMEERFGTEKSIPQMILAGASCDDVFVIVLFSTFVTMAQGGTARLSDFAAIPVSILLGVLFGIMVGFAVHAFFTAASSIRSSMKALLILAVSFLLMWVETMLQDHVNLSGLLAVIAMACTVKTKSSSERSARLSDKFGKLWIAAEILLFVLVGAAVDIRYTLNAGFTALAMILIALVFRAVGVWLCLLGTALNAKERLFCVIAYLPKATVQAAIGAVPLSLGLPCGNIVLSVAVLAILVTAPLGAIGIDVSYQKLLGNQKESKSD